MNDRPNTIAIDGPAASGKSTVGQLVAERLGFLYFDTGALYRAITLLALERGLDLEDEQALGKLAEETIIEIEPPRQEHGDDRQYSVIVDGKDITWDIRRRVVDRYVSEVAAQPPVRQALVRQQRRVGLRGEVVMVGRDIGTVVMYDAPLKVYLDASLEERARRRYEERQHLDQEVEYETLLADMRARDRFDASRDLSPMRPAMDAYIINSSDLAVGEVVENVLALARAVMDLPEKEASAG